MDREGDRRSVKVNAEQPHKIIIPLPPRYIIEKLQLGPIELSWDQVKVMFVCAILTTIIIGTGHGTVALVLNVVAIAIIWGLLWKYARTHEVLVESKLMFRHKIRKIRGMN